MGHRSRSVLLLLLALEALAAAPPAGAREAVSPGRLSLRLAGVWERFQDEDPIVAWVYFTDKGAIGKAGRLRPDLVSDRSLERRRKVRPESALVDATDLPVPDAYVQEIARRVERVRQRSKWFNAVSVTATRAQLASLRRLPFVREIDLVARFRRAAPPEDVRATDTIAAAPGVESPARVTALDYGASFKQLDQIQVPSLHDQGITGAGVVIGHFDNGHRLLTHESFASMNIVATHDFVDGDTDPAPNPGDPTNWGAHGVITLSALGGFKSGQLIGPAYGAAYILARTEDDGSETPVEEDNWVAAMEWADSIGVDVTSTSLAYLDFDPPFTSWTWEDMDGNTTLITRAGDMAVARGIVVVNAAGNAGAADSTHNTLLAPADGDSVITVGAVDSLGVRTGFSSIGPTADGRTKPDVMARGRRTLTANTTGNNAYATFSGTSLSCPLVAGVAALLVAAHPAATPMQIRDALRSTASQAGSPDNFMGWGIIDALAAHEYLTSTDTPRIGVLPAFRLIPVAPNPFNPGAVIRYELPERAEVTLRIYDVRGRLVRTLIAGPQPASAHAVTWNGTSDRGLDVASGTYFVQMRAKSLAAGSMPFRATQKVTLVR